MVRVSKPPEIRKQELVDIALALFMERGYEKVSVRDILKEVNGAPGMFYHYFESKQEIYNEAMKQMVNREVKKREQILTNKSLPIIERFRNVIDVIENGIRSYYKTFNSPDNIPYEETIIMQLLTAMAAPVSQVLLEAVEERIIPVEAGVTTETAHPMALFIIHGCYGLIHNYRQDEPVDNVRYFTPFILNFLKISPDIL